MKLALILFCLFFTYLTQAAQLEASIVDVQADAKTMVKLSTGQVLWIQDDAAMVAAVEEAMEQDRQVLIDFDSETHFIHGVQLSEAKSIKTDEVSSTKRDDVEPVFYPTVFNSYDQIKRVHDSNDNRTHEDSQCYNRAHGWAYDMHRLHGVNSMKIFLFFTDRYIREYDHKWWFHVSPMAYVREGNYTNEYVMDRSFSESPVYPQVWTNIFIKNQAVCRSVPHWDYYRQDDPNEELREARQQAFIFAREYDI